MAQSSNLPQERRPTQFLVRFFLQMTILVTFAAFGSIGFERSLVALLGMSTVISAAIGIVKREPPFGAVLNYWDETVAYAALFALVSGFNHSVPV